MQVSFVLRQFNASDELKQLIQDKITKRFEHLLNGESEVRVTLSTEKSRTVLDITVNAWGEVFKSHETTLDLYPTIDSVLDKVERQIQKKKDMFQKRRTSGRKA